MIDHLIAGLTEWQIYGLVVGLLLQGIVLAVAPEEVIVMSLGVLWSQGKVHFPLAIAAIALGLLPANFAIVYIAGRFSHLAFFKKKAIHVALENFRKKGKWIIFVTRFTPFLRSPVYYAAGISGMTVLEFFRMDALAFCIQAPIVFFIGAAIGARTGSITDAYKIIVTAAVTSAVLLVGVTLIRERALFKSTPP